MNYFTIALGCVNARELHKGHFGDSNLFVVYKITSEDNYEKLRVINNEEKNADESGTHGKEKKRGGVLKLLGDVEIIVAGKMSPNLKRINEKKSILPAISSSMAVSEIKNYFKKNYKHYSLLIAKKKRGGILEIPTILS